MGKQLTYWYRPIYVSHNRSLMKKILLFCGGRVFPSLGSDRMTHFVIDPVAIDLGFIQIIGMALCAFLVFCWLRPRNLLNWPRAVPHQPQADVRFLTWIALEVILGGRRRIHDFLSPERCLKNASFLYLGRWHSLGGLIGVILGADVRCGTSRTACVR